MFELKVAGVFIVILGSFAWGLYLHRLKKASRIVKIVTWTIIMVGVLFTWFVSVFPGDRITHYDKDHNKTGYSERDGNRESHFDKSGKRQGYSVYEGNRADRFDNEWNRRGHDTIDDEPQTERGEEN